MKTTIKSIAAVATFVAAVQTYAGPLVIKSGEVLVKNADGSQSTVHASETQNGQRQLAKDGYLVVGNHVIIDVSEAGIEGVDTATVSIQDVIQGEEALKSALGEAIAGEIAEGVASGAITEIAGKQLSGLNAEQLEEIANAVDTGDIGVEVINTVSSILDDAGIDLSEALSLSEEEARARYGDAVVDQVNEAIGQ